MDIVWIALGVICVLFVLFLIAGYLAYKKAFFSIPNPNRSPYKVPNTDQHQKHKDGLLDLIGKLDSEPYESVTVKSFDGLTLHGRYYHKRDGAPVHIAFHGYRSYGVRDFCGGYQIISELDHNTLIIDQRAHLASQGNTISFGVKERFDVLTWVSYINERFGQDTPVFLVGVSMGAGTVLMSSGLKLPSNVLGIIADCPFSAPWDILSKVCADMKLPTKACFPVACAAARIFGGFDLLGASATEAVKNTKTPILIIHGDDDRLVPHDMSVAIANANPDKVTLVTVKDAGHALAYFEDIELYTRSVIEFTNKCLKEASRNENN